MEIDKMKEYIKEAKIAYPQLKVLVLTGGECMIYRTSIANVINYASKKYNLFVRIVTNGFWATSFENSLNVLQCLIDAGLNEINFSTGDEHQLFIPIENIRNGILASVDIGLKPLVNIESNDYKKFTSKYFIKDNTMFKLIRENKLDIINGLWIPFKTISNDLKNDENLKITYNHQPCDNLFNTISIDPNHRMLACCGLTAKFVNFLDIGDVDKVPIKDLYENQFKDFIKIWLYVDGPYKILEFILQYIKFDIAMYNKLHDCQICAAILKNKQFLNVLQLNYKKVYANIMFKYLIKIKSYENK